MHFRVAVKHGDNIAYMADINAIDKADARGQWDLEHMVMFTECKGCPECYLNGLIDPKDKKEPQA